MVFVIHKLREDHLGGGTGQKQNIWANGNYNNCSDPDASHDCPCNKQIMQQ